MNKRIKKKQLTAQNSVERVLNKCIKKYKRVLKKENALQTEKKAQYYSRSLAKRRFLSDIIKESESDNKKGIVKGRTIRLKRKSTNSVNVPPPIKKPQSEEGKHDSV